MFATARRGTRLDNGTRGEGRPGSDQASPQVRRREVADNIRPTAWDARSVYYGSFDEALSAIQSPSYLRGGLVLFSQLRQHRPVDQADVRN
jgi:hypothetical protein